MESDDRGTTASVGEDQRMQELEASAKRAREYAEELEAQLERIRTAKRQRVDLGAEEAPVEPSNDSTAQETSAAESPDLTAITHESSSVDESQIATETPATEKAEPPRYVLSRLPTAEPRLPNTMAGATWQSIVQNSPFITMEDIGVAPDAVLISLAQFQTCLLANDDRMGRYKHQEIGYVGICCKYCFGQPGYGRFFPSTSSSFVSSFPQTVVKHVSEDCLGTPRWIMDLVSRTNDTNQRSEPTHASHFGSKGLMEKIWKIIRSGTPDDVPAEDPQKELKVLSIAVNEADEHSMTWGDVIGNANKLVKISDQYLVPASLFATVAQFEPCEANEFDCRSIGRNRPTINPGYPGICCKYCKGDTPPVLPGARVFPAQPGSLSQIDTCSKIQSHIEQNRCGNIPDGILRAIQALRDKEKEEARRYGSRKIFFQKIWDRLHGSDSTRPSEPASLDEADDLPLKMELPGLVEGSCLINLEQDRGMVSDAHLVAFAQMKPCSLTKEDQSGWYKDREIGFPGVCCKHCEGRPSSGRYFPKHGDFFLRSSKQSIIKHVTENCGSCPEAVRDSLLELQRREKRRKGWKITNQSVLGQGKLFHERVWRRLYVSLGVDTLYPMPPAELTLISDGKPKASDDNTASGSALLSPAATMQSTVLHPSLRSRANETSAGNGERVTTTQNEPREASAATALTHGIEPKITTTLAPTMLHQPTPSVNKESTQIFPQLAAQQVKGTTPAQIHDVVEDVSHPSGGDRDWVNWKCLVRCKSLQELLDVIRSPQLERITLSLAGLRNAFLSKLRPLYPNEPLHENIGFQAQHNWYADWARRVRSGDVSSFQLTLDRRACRTVLFRVLDLWLENALNRNELNENSELGKWIVDAFSFVVPMERAECLFSMRGVNQMHYGMHWVSKLEDPNHPLLADVIRSGGKPAMNKRFSQIVQDLLKRVASPDTIKLASRLLAPTECPREPIVDDPIQVSVLDLPNDLFVGGKWVAHVIHPRDEVLERIADAELIEHFIFVYKSETFTNILRVLRSAPHELSCEDIEMFIKFFERLFHCVQDQDNDSVTKQSVLEKFKKQSFTNVLDQIIPLATRRNSTKCANWPPKWLVDLCETFELDELRHLLKND